MIGGTKLSGKRICRSRLTRTHGRGGDTARVALTDIYADLVALRAAVEIAAPAKSALDERGPFTSKVRP